MQLVQNPDSFIALKWCVEHGVYPDGWEPEKAHVVLEKRKQHVKEHGYSAPPKKKRSKSSGSGSSSGSNIIDSTATAMDDGGMWEAQGRSEL